MLIRRLKPYLPWIAVIGVGVLLRVLLWGGLGTLWNDEAFSRHFALIPVGRILELMRLDVHPPLHTLVLHYWMALFGSGALAVRGMSLVLGAAGLAAFAALGRKLFDRRTAMLALLLAALSPIMVYYGVDARMYAAVFLLSCLSMRWFWMYVDGDVSVKRFWFWVSLALALTHITGVMVLAAQGFYLLREPARRPAFRKLLPSLLLIALVFSLWFVPAALVRLQTLDQEWQFGSAQEKLGAPQALVYWVWLGQNRITLTIVFIAAGLLVLGGLMRRSERRPFFRMPPESELLLLWLLCCFLPFLALSNVTPRYLTAAIPPFFLLLCHGFLNAAKGRKAALFLGALGILLLTLPGLIAQLTARPYNWDTTAAWIADRKRPEDRVVFGWFADRLAVEALDDPRLAAVEIGSYGFYPFDDELDADERIASHAGTLAIQKKDFERLGPLFDDAPRVFFIPNYYLAMAEGGTSSEPLNAWLADNGWYLADHLGNEGRTPGVWLMVRKD